MFGYKLVMRNDIVTLTLNIIIANIAIMSYIDLFTERKFVVINDGNEMT